MSVSLDEHRLGGLRWIVAPRPRPRGVSRARGARARRDGRAHRGVGHLLKRLPGTSPARRQRSPPRVRRAASCAPPEAWDEGLPRSPRAPRCQFDDLALMNSAVTRRHDGGIGCSDLAWRRGRSVIGHNEDGAPENVGQCAVLTLALDGLPTVTAFWYPGFLPTNAFTVTADGLVWTIDHLPVAPPGAGPAAFRRPRPAAHRTGPSKRQSTACKINSSAGGFA